MAYDRYDTRDAPRDERARWSDERYENRDRGGREDRGFFERAGDEISSWFGDDDAERRRRQDHMREQREAGYGSRERDSDRDRNRMWGGRDEDGGSGDRRFERNEGRGDFGGERERRDRDFGRTFGSERDRDYRPVTGDYGRGSSRESGQFFSAGGAGRGERGFGQDRGDYDRSQSEWGRDPYRRTSRAGTSDRSDRSRHEDPHYDSWRQRHMSELDRDYDDYRRENQSRFEDDFSGWRERRQQKRGLLGQIREHMEVVGNDDKHVGTVDRAISDRIILTKSDPDSGGTHHSLSCAEIDRIEGDRVILDCSADEAKKRWRDESRNRALFEREDQGEMGPRVLDRSFEGTYRR